MKNWNKFECKDGSIYFWKYDDGRIAVKTGLDNIVWFNLQILQFLEAELNITRDKEGWKA